MEADLVNLGRSLARAQDAQLRETLDIERGRARLLETVRAKPRRPPALLLVAAAALGLGVALFLWLRAPDAVQFRVAGASQPGKLEQPLRAEPARPLRLDFSDGTELELFEHAEARVVSADHRGATLRVERGTVRARVVHRRDSRWLVRLGPFSIDVLGTRFETRWQPETERFTLFLAEGAVTVSGPVVGSQRAIRAGETLSISCRDGKLSLVRDERTSAAVAPSAPVTPAAAAPLAIPEPSARGAPGLDAAPTAPPALPLAAADFRQLARANQYERALQSAERAGFEDLCRSAGAADLLLLGDTARLAGSATRAEQAYQAVRTRFGGAKGAQAAFLLGRLAFEARSDFAAAARYFALSLLEEPGGPFSRDAAGRLVESLERSGDATGARAAATRYLARHPDGPHATLAKSLLARP